MRITKWTQKWFDRVFKPAYKHRLEQVILALALIGFSVHLILILVFDIEKGVVIKDSTISLLVNPISAVYTPFSFILIFEVFLLIYYLPSSFTTAIGKQYEIISLIILRRIFKDIAKVEVPQADKGVAKSGKGYGWDEVMGFIGNPKNIDLIADMIGVLIIFFLIYLFYRLMKVRPRIPSSRRHTRFVNIKKLITLVLLPVLTVLSLYAFIEWLIEISHFNQGIIDELSNINNVFYEEFFLILILIDVFLLIISLNFTDRYSVIIRNAGFVVSTILIRLSFSFEGWVNTSLIIGGVAFGVMIHYIYNLLGHQELEVMREEAEKGGSDADDEV